jgi:phosphatidylglycerophosphatase A
MPEAPESRDPRSKQGTTSQGTTRGGEGPLATLLLSAFGLGSSPWMPGTVGSLGTVLAIWILPGTPLAQALLCGVLCLYGCLATLAYAHLAEGPDGHGDPGWVVSDEVAGQALACAAALPLGGGWPALLAAFVLFRLFDIWKPGPVGTLEKLPGGVGVLMDDIGAGVLAGIGVVLLQVSGLLPGT